MENWKKVNRKKLETYMTPVQLDCLSQGLEDRLDDLISDITAQIWVEVWTYPNVPLSQDPSLVHPSLMAPTCHLIIEALQSRFPSLELSEAQVRNANNARAFLKRIAEGKVTLREYKGDQFTRKLTVSPERTRLATQRTLTGL